MVFLLANKGIISQGEVEALVSINTVGWHWTEDGERDGDVNNVDRKHRWTGICCKSNVMWIFFSLGGDSLLCYRGYLDSSTYRDKHMECTHCVLLVHMNIVNLQLDYSLEMPTINQLHCTEIVWDCWETLGFFYNSWLDFWSSERLQSFQVWCAPSCDGLSGSCDNKSAMFCEFIITFLAIYTSFHFGIATAQVGAH